LALMEEARAIDPDLPFAYWDPFRVQLISLVPGGTPQQNLEQARRALQGSETFLEVAGRKPVASYYYLPQHAPDMESFVRSQIDTHRGTVANWERAVNGGRR
jgi:enamine deaminase RidA (YjgF/YER057c/UK114 family)